MSAVAPQLARAAFHSAELDDLLASATDDELHGAEFGIIAMSNDCRVTFYNRYEQDVAGLSENDVVGRHFFVEVAPCTNNFMVRDQYVQAWQEGKDLDDRRPYMFSYRMTPTRVELRMLVRGQHGWLLVLKL